MKSQLVLVILFRGRSVGDTVWISNFCYYLWKCLVNVEDQHTVTHQRFQGVLEEMVDDRVTQRQSRG